MYENHNKKVWTNRPQSNTIGYIMQNGVTISAADTGSDPTESGIDTRLAGFLDGNEELKTFVESHQFGNDQLHSLLQIMLLATSNSNLNGNMGESQLDRLLQEGSLSQYKGVLLRILEHDDKTSQAKLPERIMCSGLAELVQWFKGKKFMSSKLTKKLTELANRPGSVADKTQLRDFLFKEKRRVLGSADVTSQDANLANPSSTIPSEYSDEDSQLLHDISVKIFKHLRSNGQKDLVSQIAYGDYGIPPEEPIADLPRKSNTHSSEVSGRSKLVKALLAMVLAIGGYIGLEQASKNPAIAEVRNKVLDELSQKLNSITRAGADIEGLKERVDLLRSRGKENSTVGNANNADMIADMMSQLDLSFATLVKKKMLSDDDYYIWKQAIDEARARSQQPFKSEFLGKLGSFLDTGSSADEVFQTINKSDSSHKWLFVLAQCQKSAGSDSHDDYVATLNRQEDTYKEVAETYWEAAKNVVNSDPELASLFFTKALAAGQGKIGYTTPKDQEALLKEIEIKCLDLADKFSSKGESLRAEQLREYVKKMAEQYRQRLQSVPTQLTLK